MRTIIASVFVLLLTANSTAIAEVSRVTEHGFTSTHRLVLQASPADAYRTLTDDVHLWWDADHSYSGNANNFSITAKGGGCFCEQLSTGGSVEHMHVVYADPGNLLRMTGGLGPLQAMGVSGAMSFEFKINNRSQTELLYTYVVNGYQYGGWSRMAEAVDQVQLHQLSRLQRLLRNKASQ